jgi:hypothetical protein
MGLRLASMGIVALLGLGLPACGGDDNQVSGNPSQSLDCGKGKAGSEDALRQFVAVLRRGDAQEILSVLAKPGRFEWITVGDARGPDLSVRNDRERAAEAVAQRGGLPIKVTRFTNSEPPHRTTDFGFQGLWDGTRPFIGKAALDCQVGKARVIVISIGVPTRSARIIRSFSVELLNPRVARLHWTLDSRAVLSLDVEGVRHGATRLQPAGILPVPPSDEQANRPVEKGAGTANVNFEFGEFNFEGVPKVRFTLLARNSTGRDESQSITRDPTP